MDKIAELFSKCAEALEKLQSVAKQHNVMMLDIYERISALEVQVAELKREQKANG